jgi:hypothetical protein
MPRAEYLTAEARCAIGAAFSDEQADSSAAVQEFLKRLSPAWSVVGGVHFNLADKRKNVEAPFAFLATYTSRLSAHGQVQHQPSARRSASTRVRPIRSGSSCSSCRFSARRSAQCSMDS